jgi:multidrug resistance protein MdtO
MLAELAGLLLDPFPGRLEFALRLATIAAAVTLVGEIYQVPDLALAVYVVFFLNKPDKPDRMMSMLLAVVLTLLLTLCIGLILVLALLTLDHPFWKVTAITVVSFAMLFLGSASKLRPVASIVALIVGFGLDFVTQLPIGDLTSRALLYAWLFLLLPAPISIVINLLMGPTPRALVQRDLALRLRLAAALLRGPDEASHRELTKSLREGDTEMLARLKLAALEHTSPAADLARLRQAATSSVALLALVELTARDPEAALPDPIGSRLAATLEEMAGIFGAGGYPAEITREDIAVPAAAGAEPARAAALSPRAAAVLSELQAVLTGFTSPPAADQPSGGAPAAPAKPAQRGGFFQADAFTNPEHVAYALKTTAAALICYFLYMILDWSKIHTAFITCYIVAQASTAETAEKFALRLAGALLGAAAGIGAIITIIPYLTDIQELMALVFLGTLAGGWIAAGGPRIGYAGFQFAFAFYLCVIQLGLTDGAGPSFDMTTARDRVIGILLGNVVTYVIFTTAWPTSIGQRIDPAIAGAVRRLRALLVSARQSRMAAMGQLQEALAGIDEELALTRYEPDSIRPQAAWVERRSRAVSEMAALSAPLLVGVGTREAAALDHRLARLEADAAGGETETDACAPACQDVAAGNEGAQRAAFGPAMEGHLRRLEKALARDESHAENHAPDAPHVPAP